MTERWDATIGARVEDPAVDRFLAAIVAVCRQHKMSLGHEDSYGAFEVVKQVVEDNIAWIESAHIVGCPGTKAGTAEDGA